MKKNEIRMTRLHYGQKVYGVEYDNGKEGGFVELAPGVEPSRDNVLRAILDKEWPEDRQHALLVAALFRPDDPDTIKEKNARAFDYEICREAAAAAWSAWQTAQTSETV